MSVDIRIIFGVICAFISLVIELSAYFGHLSYGWIAVGFIFGFFSWACIIPLFFPATWKTIS